MVEHENDGKDYQQVRSIFLKLRKPAMLIAGTNLYNEIGDDTSPFILPALWKKWYGLLYRPQRDVILIYDEYMTWTTQEE